jgi:hypothetical protein
VHLVLKPRESIQNTTQVRMQYVGNHPTGKIRSDPHCKQIYMYPDSVAGRNMDAGRGGGHP